MRIGAHVRLRDARLKSAVESELDSVEHLLQAAVESSFPFATDAANHLVNAGGKRFRPLLTLVASHLGSGPNHLVRQAAVVCELTHVATLFHDDVMDEATLRRGIDSANARWGNTVAILTGDFLFSKASQILAGLGPEAVRIQAETFERLCIGQINETRGPQDGQDRIEHHLQVLSDKTGSLIATSLHFGGLFSDVDESATEALTRYGERIGVAFQLADDIVDVVSDDSGKTPGTDLREGVPTLPSMLVAQMARPGDEELIARLSAPIGDDSVVAETLAQLRAHPAIDEARSIARHWAGQARNELADIPASAARDALDTICDFVVERTT